MTQLAIPNSPAVKNKDAWVNIENIDKKDLALRRMHTLSPRINHHDQAYESAVIT